MERDPRTMLIINPISGTTAKDGIDQAVIRRLQPLGMQVDVRYTTCRGDATRLAREAASLGYGSVLAVGGDGTVNETARALGGTSTAMAIIPAGSGNGLARHIGLPIDPLLSIDVVAQQHIQPVDYGSVNSKEFFVTMGVGFDATVAHNFARQSRRGLLTYVKSAVEEYLHYAPEVYTIEAGGELLTEQAFIIAVANASQYGNNAYIAPGASITDGLLDVTVIHAGDTLSTAFVGFDMMTGYLNRNVKVHTLRVPSLTIYRSTPGPAHIDGEPVDMDRRLDIICHPGALHMYTPLNKMPFKPVLTPIASTLSDALIAMRRMLHIK